MFKILNRTDKDISKNTTIVSKKMNDSDLDFNFEEILTILDNGLYKKNTIMYDEDTRNIFIYDEESHRMVANQQEINKIIVHLVEESVKNSIDLLKKINTLSYDEIKKLIDIHTK